MLYFESKYELKFYNLEAWSLYYSIMPLLVTGLLRDEHSGVLIKDYC